MIHKVLAAAFLIYLAVVVKINKCNVIVKAVLNVASYYPAVLASTHECLVESEAMFIVPQYNMSNASLKHLAPRRRSILSISLKGQIKVNGLPQKL